jgi:uncharacterized BrkB/YihY/UPF0761 family membrane protein
MFGRSIHRNPISRRRGRSVWPFVIFLGFFAILLTIVSRWYLLPALDAFNHADARGRKLLAVHALLVMSLVLFILVVSMILIFRVGRFFFPGPPRVKTITKYTDAWAEAGKRLETKKDEE